ncbi:MAG TPA: CotH kinase family protein, partial [Polyangia bacterium]|nr:CotH kinase family protein [Polyangia bacterium]
MGTGGSPDKGGLPPTNGASPLTPGGPPCPDLFDEDAVRTYALDIAPDVWNSIQGEFHDLTSLLASGNDFVVRHPVVLHMGDETVTGATLKLHGQSSWAETVMLDGPRAKIQFDISFHQGDPNGKFHGVEKLVFDMPRSDWTFLHDRLAHAWFRQVGIAAGCAASARVEINGAYYGLYVAEENTNKRVLAEFFPDNTGGLWKAGQQPETSATLQAGNVSRQMAFAKAKDLPAIAAIVDLKSSVLEWAGEALINDADGFYGGTHNFYVYDYGGKGFVYLPNDTDSTFDWMVQNDITPANAHPIAWWLNRTQPQPAPPTVWTVALNDPGWRAQYVAAIATQLGKWDVAQIQGWIDTWSQQIAADVTSDPHTVVTPAQFQMAVAQARDVVAKRAQYLQSFVACEQKRAAPPAAGVADLGCP